MRTPNVSSELLWGIVKDNSSFLVKRRQTGRCVSGNKGPQFTTEPGNVAGINSYKYSGLANAKAVGLSAGASGGAVLTTKTRKSSRVSKPAKLYNTVSMSRDFRRVAKTIKKETANYRPDLQKAALAKWSVLHAAQKRTEKAK